MSDQSENLPDENRAAGESLDFTAEELLQELSEYFSFERRQPGDLDVGQMVEYYKEKFGLGEDRIRRIVARLVEEGKLSRFMVIGPKGKRIAVFRKPNA